MFLLKETNFFKICYNIQNKCNVDRCRFCRRNFNEICVCCHLNDLKMFKLDFLDVDIKKRQRDLIYIYFLVRQRFCKDITKKILKLIIFNVFIERQCAIIRGDCGHIFHDHCMNKWIKRRQNCPFCNSIWKKQETNVITELFLYPKIK
jgi:hypothetical protein